MQWLAEICVKRPIFATVLSLLILVVGTAGYFTLGLDRFPRIDFPFVTVTTILPGASPEDMETDVSEKIEAAVNTIGDIDELRSVSAEGLSLVVVQFRLEKDVDVAAQDVRDRVSAIRRDLPKDIEDPIITKIDPDASPILFATLSGPGRSITEVTEYASKEVREALEVVPGVGQVRVLGGRDREIAVELDAVRLSSLGVSPAEVVAAIQKQNINIPGGRIDTGRDQMMLKIHGRVEDPQEIANLSLRTVGDGAIRVRDVATVVDGPEEAETSAALDGSPAVMLSIRKQSGANTVAVADAIRGKMEEIRPNLPRGYALDVIRDESQSIRTSVNGVKEHLVVGALLAALVVLLFLGSFRSTIIAAVAIPTSVVGTFALMSAVGYTLNTITLLALALSVGIVIDDAIVVLENIYRHVEEKGSHPMVAAVEGTREIGLAVLATTFSLIAVFLPVAFLAGIPGRFLRSFGVTMSFAIAVSLFVSFSLTPMLASRWLKPKIPGQHEAPPLGERIVLTFYRPIERVYMTMLRFAMAHRWVVVVAGIASLGMMLPLGAIAKKGFLPIDDRAQFEVTVRAPEGTSIASTAVYGERVAREIRAIEDVKMTLTTIGTDDQSTDNLARIYVRLSDPEERSISQDQFMEKVRQEVIAYQPPELKVSAGVIPDIGGTGASTARIQYNLVGPDLEALEGYAKHIVAELKQVKGAVDVDSSLIVGKPEVGVYVDRGRADALGISVSDIATTLQLLVGGYRAGTYAEGGEQYNIRVRAAGRYRNDENALSLLTIPVPRVGLVPVTSLVKLAREEGPSVITRLARQRTVTITANAAPGVGDNIVGDAIKDIVAGMNLSSSYTLMPAGQTKLMAETARSVLFGFGLAFIFMYLILAAQFESWVHPFTILLALPLTLPFALLSLVITGQALDMFSVLGIFVLFGIVKKNGILQVDHTNQLRAKGMPRLEAILQANKDRLRPILMTTVAFVAGMMPLVLSQGIGSGFNRATAGVVVGGQTFSLLLTLLATPVAYSILDDLLLFGRRQLVRVGILSVEA